MKCKDCRYNDIKDICLNVNSTFFMCRTDVEKTKNGCESFIQAKKLECEKCTFLQKGVCINADSDYFMCTEYVLITRKGCERGKEKDK